MIISDYRKCKGCGKYFKEKELIEIVFPVFYNVFKFPLGDDTKCCKDCMKEYVNP